MACSNGRVNMTESAIKVGVIADQTGPLSAMGIANANVAPAVTFNIFPRGTVFPLPLVDGRNST